MKTQICQLQEKSQQQASQQQASKQQQATRKNKRGLSSSKWQESFIGQLWLSARMEQQSQQESSTKEVA